jgi:hypothetical protein
LKHLWDAQKKRAQLKTIVDAVLPLRAAAKQFSVSFPDCHGAYAPRNDGFILVRFRLPAFFDKSLTGRTWY